VSTKAIGSRNKVWISYARADREPSERVIRPDRIEDYRVLDEQFDGNDGVSLESFLVQMRQETRGGPRLG
jgi:predicted DNA-binding transcriptional regulator YafY